LEPVIKVVESFVLLLTIVYGVYIDYFVLISLLLLAVVAEKDLLLLGMISSLDTENTGALTACPKRKNQSSREHQRTSYMVDAHLVCRDTCTFKFVNRLEYFMKVSMISMKVKTCYF